jgi:four helix bundle protein
VVESYRDLIVWQKAMDAVEDVYQLAKDFPEYERYGLWSQFTRTAVSIPANIAEGSRRGSRRDYAQFVAVARGSLAEAETFLMISVRLGYIVQKQAEPEFASFDEISRMLNALRASLLR